jgi:metal-dependent HD superfamily phosphatase/phosphodiesterase
MSLIAQPTFAPSPPVYHGPSSFSVPARHNPRLQALVDRINADEELRQMWRCANVNAVERLGASDHGETHIRIVANASLRMLRLLMEAGYTANVVSQHGLGREDAELNVVLAAALHDLGLVVHYDRHHEFGLPLAFAKARELLDGLYGVRERTILVSEVMHAIATHFNGLACFTIEAGILRVADALDMTRGRSRSVDGASATAIQEVTLHRGEQRPVRIEVRMNHASGLAHAGEILQQRIRFSTLHELIEVVARIDNGTERRLVPLAV